MDPRVAALVEELRSAGADRAEETLDALDALGPGAVPDLLPLFRDPDERVRAAALGHAARHGSGDPATVREVLRGAQAALRIFSDASRAAEVHEAILGLEEPVAALVPSLLRDAAAPDQEARLPALRDLETVTHYLGTAGREGEVFLGALVDALDASETEARWWAAQALGNLCLEPARTVPALARRLPDPEPAVRLAALEALERFGADAAEALPAVLPAFRDPETEVASRAVLVAGRVGGGSGPVVDALAGLVASPEPRLRTAAAAAFGEIGNAPGTVLEALAAAAASDADQEVRRVAAWALDRIRRIHGS